jgi:hypothetical protein
LVRKVDLSHAGVDKQPRFKDLRLGNLKARNISQMLSPTSSRVEGPVHLEKEMEVNVVADADNIDIA